jgi:hypothetical protein
MKFPTQWILNYATLQNTNLPLSHVKPIVIYRRNSVLRVHLKKEQTLVQSVSVFKHS